MVIVADVCSLSGAAHKSSQIYENDYVNQSSSPNAGGSMCLCIMSRTRARARSCGKCIMPDAWHTGSHRPQNSVWWIEFNYEMKSVIYLLAHQWHCTLCAIQNAYIRLMKLWIDSHFHCKRYDICVFVCEWWLRLRCNLIHDIRDNEHENDPHHWITLMVSAFTKKIMNESIRCLFCRTQPTFYCWTQSIIPLRLVHFIHSFGRSAIMYCQQIYNSINSFQRYFQHLIVCNLQLLDDGWNQR